MVIADEGVRGTTVEVATRGIESRFTDDARVELTVQAGEPWDEFVAYTVERELSGIECLSGIPGSTGATPIQNVGAYGQEVSSVISSVRVLDRASGEILEMPAEECGFAYRTSRFKGRTDFVVLVVTFLLNPSAESEPVAYAQLADALGVEPGIRAPLAAVRETVLELRRSKSMVIDPEDPNSVSAGSFFTNPILSALEMDLLENLAAGITGTEDPPPAWPTGDGRVQDFCRLADRTGRILAGLRRGPGRPVREPHPRHREPRRREHCGARLLRPSDRRRRRADLRSEPRTGAGLRRSLLVSADQKGDGPRRPVDGAGERLSFNSDRNNRLRYRPTQT